MPELRFEGVGKAFDGHVALADVDLTLPSGQLTAIIGPTGCGKTTLLEMTAGLQPATRGRILIDGDPVTGPRADTVMIFQNHNLFDWLTVRDNVAFGLRNRRLSRGAARQRAMAQLGNVGLAGFADRVPGELSGGMRQRVALARALVVAPRLLLMDEPFASLDHQTRRIMQRYLLATWRKSEATVLLVTHDLDEALALADRIVMLSAAPARVAEVVDLSLPRPRDPDDPRLREIRDKLRRHLETEVALHEFTGAELAALAQEVLS
jgi:NitT/TauT family transport system ATP-binding protein